MKTTLTTITETQTFRYVTAVLLGVALTLGVFAVQDRFWGEGGGAEIAPVDSSEPPVLVVATQEQVYSYAEPPGFVSISATDCHGFSLLLHIEPFDADFFYDIISACDFNIF